MTLRKKLSWMLSVFLVIIAILATGTILIFGTLNEHLSSLATVSEETKVLNELGRSITDFVESVKEFGLTGDIKYKKLYGKKLSAVYKSFGIINAKTEHRADLQLISLKFQGLDLILLYLDLQQHPWQYAVGCAVSLFGEFHRECF